MHYKQDCLSFEGGPFLCVFMTLRPFCSCELDLEPMTLIYELDVAILKIYLCAKMKFLDQGFLKLENEHDKQTYRHRETDATERITSHIPGR